MSRLAEASLAQFLADAREEFEAACAASGEAWRVRFGERTLRLRFATTELADALLPALEARCLPDGPADVAIGLWESRAPLPWRDADLAARGLLRGAASAPIVVHELGSGAVTAVAPSRRELLYRVPAVAELPWWERAAPLRPAFFWALSEAERGLVHAGVVGDDRGGALLAGPGGSGKTTVALAALESGWRYVGDDYVLLDLRAEPTAWNLYGTAKLDDGHRARFPALSAGATRSPAADDDEKWVLDVDPGALAERLAVRAVVVPRIAGGPTRVGRISPAAALLALAPSTLFQMPYDHGGLLAPLAGLVRSVPCFALDVGDDPAALVAALDEVLG
jgi:hypothetical protein